MKFEENRSKTAAVTVLQFFRQYGCHDVIMTAKFLKTRLENLTYILSNIWKKKLKSVVKFDQKAQDKHSKSQNATIFKIKWPP